MEQWRFEDPPNVAVLSDRGIFKSGDWIAYVVHEADDDDSYSDEGGSWQFHNSETGPVDEGDIMIVRRDESILELADLPKGWHAWRSSKSSPWQRAKSLPVPSNDNE
ncbi:hypothetical protein [Mesorhizobium opportunistum]|uniref:DUF2185 domain-containing protein n=1 Tax=Mesorhizobium opportunistum (strain LMG 24607 / HAMBI 3007 / WSM2075) TaxID=536019 RepID=F7YF93_MESOW|nr:hypothetical protein [Mesorhizobium opportunistum]AEH84546.1 conserved hypothetical protein [Mesorhizobium opportunistum WSM2075]